MGGHSNMVVALVSAGAAADPGHNKQDAPLPFAARNGHTETVRTLIEAGADVRAQG